MGSLTYVLKEHCPKCNEKTQAFGTHNIGYSRYWMEFCKSCGWFFFVESPKGTELLKLQINGVQASDEDLEIINKILFKATEKTEGNFKELK